MLAMFTEDEPLWEGLSHVHYLCLHGVRVLHGERGTWDKGKLRPMVICESVASDRACFYVSWWAQSVNSSSPNDSGVRMEGIVDG